MSKTFSNAGGNRDITVISDTHDHFMLRVRENITARSISVSFDSDQAPALALAILEAAGFTEESPNFGTAVHELGLAIKERDHIIAEAEAQAKLKAEALRLANEFYGADWDFFPCSRTVEMQQWLAVARRAREINKEEK